MYNLFKGSTFGGKRGINMKIFLKAQTESKVSLQMHISDICSFAEQHQVLQHCLTPARKRLTHIAVLMHRVDRVHVCGPTTSLSCLTYIFPAHSPTILALFFSVWPDLSYLLSGHGTRVFREGLFTVYHGSTLMHTHTAATHNRQWQWPSSKQ